MSNVLYVWLVGTTLLLLAAVLTGLGLLVRRIWRQRNITSGDLIFAPWLGWGLAIVLLQSWNLFLPADGRALALVTIGGLAGWLWNAVGLRSWLLGRTRKAATFIVFMLAVSMWLAHHTATQPGIYDSGLYHLNAIRWAASYPVVPGLGNLHWRLAINNSSFLFAAMLGVGPFSCRAHHLASGVLLLIAIGRIFYAAFKIFRGGNSEIADIVEALFLVFVIDLVVNSGFASSPSPDLPVFLIGIAIGVELVRLLTERQPYSSAIVFRGVSIIFFSAVCITVKLSSLVAGGVAGMLTIAVLARGIEERRLKWVLWLGCAVAAVLIIAPWMTRGIVFSGYPVFPFTFCGVKADWRMPPGDLIHIRRETTSWARQPYNMRVDEVLGDNRWICPWMNRMVRDKFWVITPVLMAFAGAAVCWWRRRKLASSLQPKVWLFLALPLASLIFWFFSAPDPRFAGAAFWLLGNGLVAIAVSTLEIEAVQLVIFFCTTILFAQQVVLFDFPRQWHRDPGPAKRVEMKEFVTDSGLKVLVPIKGEQAWDSPLPAAPHSNPMTGPRVPGELSGGLRLRVPGDLSGGFRLDTELRPADKTR